jgi:hypothetical protein
MFDFDNPTHRYVGRIILVTGYCGLAGLGICALAKWAPMLVVPAVPASMALIHIAPLPVKDEDYTE